MLKALGTQDSLYLESLWAHASNMCRAWQCMSAILAHGRLRHEALYKVPDGFISHLCSGPAHNTCREWDYLEKIQKAILCKEMLHPQRVVLHPRRAVLHRGAPVLQCLSRSSKVPLSVPFVHSPHLFKRSDCFYNLVDRNECTGGYPGLHRIFKKQEWGLGRWFSG